jgi:primosomal protein N' (replication factor Y)
LKSIRDIAINYGVRGAAFAPAKYLGSVLLWNDGDDSHTEQSSPYWNSREVLLQRSELEDTRVIFSSHSPSAEVVRLIEIGFLAKVSFQTKSYEALISQSNDRLDAQSFGIISKALGVGKSVLVQIANAGWASAVVCVGCKEIRTCPNCNSSIWIDPAGMFRCRNCKFSAALQPCSCGKTGTRPTRLGASAIAAQMSKSFPNTTVVNSNGDNRLTKVQGSGILVVATPGAEPLKDDGYSVVLIADAASMIGAPRLRALEQSLAKWASAVSLARSESQIIFVGLKENLAHQLESLNFFNAVRDDYLDRIELGLPPATRLASISVSNESDFLELTTRVENDFDPKLVRRLPIDTKNTLVLDYPYNLGATLADYLKQMALELTTKSKSKKPGERVFRINMDDGKVI